MAWMPTWQVLVAFNNTAFTDPAAVASVATPAGTLGGNNVWTDITPWVRQIDTRRGRQHELNRFEAGTASFVLWNADGRFDVWNTSGPYSGLVGPSVPVQIRATFSGTTYDVWTGIADTWTELWPDGAVAQVQLDCSDVFELFNYAYMVSNAYTNQVLADGAVALWTLGDPVGSTLASDSSGNGLNLSLTSGSPGDVTFGETGFFLTNPGTSALFTVSNPVNPPALGVATTNFVSSSAPGVSAEMWVDVISTTGFGALTFGYVSGTTQLNFEVDVGNDLGGSNSGVTGQVSGANVQAATFLTPMAGTGPHHVVVTATALSGLSTTVTVYLDGVSVATVTGSVSSAALFTKKTQLAAAQAVGAGGLFFQDVAVYPSALTPTQVAANYSLGIACQNTELSGSRINGALSVQGWPSGARSIDTGNSEIQPATQAFGTTTGLTYMQQVEVSEYGCLFVNASGQVRFIARHSLLTPPYTTNQITFGDNTAGGEIPFVPAPSLATDTLDLYTAALIPRLNGVTQSWQSATNSAKYGSRTYQPGQLLNTTDAEALEYAQWIVSHFETPVPRVRQITVQPWSDPSGGTVTTAVLQRELMDRATVNRHTLPGGGTGFSQVGLIEGINHHVQFDPGSWTVDFAFTPADTQTYWVMGTSKLGVDTRLAF